MNSRFKRGSAKSRTSIVVGTGMVLIAVFLLVVMLFFIFSSMSSLFVGQCVAVVDVNMPLTIEGAPSSLFAPGYMGSEEMAAVIKELNERDDIGAVVFVFNSPGGSVVATHEVYDAVKGLDKPSVSYFREMAASGAYYIASGTDYIISDPLALTGSIGVVATVAEMEGLMSKIGVNVTSVTSGKHKDIGSPFRNITDEEHVILQDLVDEVYQEFRSVVIENRKGKLNMARFSEVEDGRVLSGRQAADIGLVDRTGNKDDAILKAAELANISAVTVDDVKICPISTEISEGGLFSAEAFISMLQAESGKLELSYK